MQKQKQQAKQAAQPKVRHRQVNRGRCKPDALTSALRRVFDANKRKRDVFFERQHLREERNRLQSRILALKAMPELSDWDRFELAQKEARVAKVLRRLDIVCVLQHPYKPRPQWRRHFRHGGRDFKSVAVEVPEFAEEMDMQ